MTDTSPSECVRPNCDQDALDPDHPAPLCGFHLENAETSEPVSQPEKWGDSAPVQDLSEFNYEDLRYIELQEVGSKFPARAWGGYSQDYDDADRVYRADDLTVHPANAWGVVGIDAVDHGTVSLLVFDLDIHKAPDDFDPSDVTIDDRVPIVRSQNGGLHAYFMVHAPRGAGAESDFQMTADLGWDIDIRGSYVSHHVVAPADIPGVDGDYELVNDARIPGVFDPADAASRIRYKGEPLLEYDSDTGVADFEFDRPTESPDELPRCYHAGLELRKAAPDDHSNTHKVNVLTALCGLAAGYDIDEVAEHFCGEWAPTHGDVDLSDVDETEYQVAHLAKKLDSGAYSPPALSTLQEWGILDHGDRCDCRITYHNTPTPDTESANAEWTVEECTPPARGTEVFDREQRWRELQGERFDAVIEHDGIDLWGDEAGAGKTTNAAIAALERDHSHVIYFDKHEKAREFITDDAIQNAAGGDTTQDPTEYFHLKGGEQKRHDRCMDADHADADYCPDHGHPSMCPSMCPVYDLEPDHDTRQAYEALVREVGPNKAHQILDLHDASQHEWHGDECAWQAQYSMIEHEDFIVGVHPYVTQKSVRQTGLNIIDETPDLHTRETTAGPTKLTRIANTLEHIADPRSRDDPVAYTAHELARFTRDIVDVITDAENADGLADLTAPTVTWNAYETYDAAAGNYLEREQPEEDWQLAEALAKAKVAHGETVLTRMQTDTWEGTPLSIDAVLAAAVEAGLTSAPVMQAVALSPVIDNCPWCRTSLDHHNGARCCASDDCDWHEAEHTLIHQGAEPARASAWFATNPTDTIVALGYRELPLSTELPSPESTLVLDATGTPDKVASLFGVTRERVRVTGDAPLEIPNLHTTQVIDGQYHAGTIQRALEDDATLATRIQRAIDTAAQIHENPLYIVKAALIPEFDFPQHGEVLHYHATRGLNRTDCDAVMCIGAPHPNVEDLQRDATLLAMGRDDIRAGGTEHSTRRDAPNPPVYRKLHYTDDHGRGRAVPTKHYTGMVGTLFRETREKELAQAIHRIRPLLAHGETKHAYLLTNVPTDIHIDELATFEELTDPLEAIIDIPGGAVDLLKAVHDTTAGRGPNGFRSGQLVEERDDGVLANKVEGYHRLAQLSGLDVSKRTVYNWVHALEEVGLLHPEHYEQHAGVSYAVDTATLKSALSVLSYNAGFKVAAVRRFRRIIAESTSGLDWLEWARDVFTLQGNGESHDPPPAGRGS